MRHVLIRAAISTAAALGFLLAEAAPSQADTWAIDKAASEIRFSWDYLGVSRRSGRFLDMEGSLEFTPTEPDTGTVELSIRPGSVSTGTREFDDILKSADFFSVTNNPRIRFRSIEVVKTGERTADVKGELTILGATRPVVLAATWNYTGEHPLAASNPTFQGKWLSGFSATTKVLRSEFGLKRGIPLVSDEVRIEIEAVFVRRD